MQSDSQIPVDKLRWCCPIEDLDFESTNELTLADEIRGQEFAWEALQFGIECSAPGQNVFVRGYNGTGRMTMIRQLLKKIAPQNKNRFDRCYVHNFVRPDRPRMISLEAGTASRFRVQIKQFARYVTDQLPQALSADYLLSRRNAIHTASQEQIDQLKIPLENDLKTAQMALVSIQQGQLMQTTIFPIVDDKPIPPEQFNQLVTQEKISAEHKQAFDQQYPEFQKRLQSLSRDINTILYDASKQIQQLNENEATTLLKSMGESIKHEFKQIGVSDYIDEMIEDVLENQIRTQVESHEPESLYDVNILIEHKKDAHSPVIIENSPSLINLLGTVEPEWGSQGPTHIDYRGIHAGALLRADGGYLVLEAKDILSEPGSWRSLIRTLHTGNLEIVPANYGAFGAMSVLKPEPIKIKVRVILLGNANLYHQLDSLDLDFSDLFKVLVDFDSEIERDTAGIKQYSRIIGQIINAENLTPFSRDAVAAVIEHGARIVSRKNKLSAKFGRIADIIREADFLATKARSDRVHAEHVVETVARTKQRASLPSRKFQEMIDSGILQIATQGEMVGQINGLAVINSGPITFGFPSRITATIAPGSTGLISIENQAEMSGAIHTKGFSILSGCLRSLLKPIHPMSFSASIAFEQSYGGIDGDSASAAELACLLSALTQIPIKQSIAMTGAIDQFGNIEAIGGVNEKIEGFFDSCNQCAGGLSTDHGVIIPHSNSEDLMLRPDIVDACRAGSFTIHAVKNIHHALEILTGMPAGEILGGTYSENTLLNIAQQKIFDFWDQSLKNPDDFIARENLQV